MGKTEQRATDRLTFLREWAANPLRTAAVAPSGARLAELITSELGPDTGPVIELGPGTGVFTRALLEQGVPPRNLTLIELNARFASHLQQAFPDLKVLNQSAADLVRLAPYGLGNAGAVVSGLGLLSMPEDVIDDILHGVFENLAPGGAFYQFTYSWRCPVKPDVLARHRLTAQQTGRTFRNVPPAQVYRITRAASDPGAQI